MRKTLLQLGLLTFLAVATVIGLYYVSQSNISISGGFTRSFRPHCTGNWTEQQLTAEDGYFAGTDKKGVYIAHYQRPLFVEYFDASHSDQLSFPAFATRGIKIDPETGKLFIQNGRVYWTDGFHREILSADIGKTEQISIIEDSLYFNLFLPLDSSTVIARIKDPKLQQHVLVSAKPGIAPGYQQKLVLEKQVDGVFCTDGQLLRRGNSDTLLYIYFYRNKWLLLNTHLQILSTRASIDTNTTVKIKVADVNHQYRTLSTPDYFSNRLSFADNRFLYIQSGAVSDNETTEDFHDNSVFDVYSLEKGNYLFSFYIPLLGEKNIREFCVIQHRLYALAGRHLRCFELKF